MSAKNRDLLMQKINHLLNSAGYNIVQLSPSSKACFDIIAKRREQLIILKISPYIDNFSRDDSYELISVASFLNASPIIVGESGKRFAELEDGLVLLRYGIPVVGIETFHNLIAEGMPPIVYCSRGRYFVQINRRLLRQSRIEKNLSYADLAQRVGVSRRTIYEYEHSINPPPETAAKLEDVLESPLAEGIRIFDLDIENEERPNYSIDNLSSMKEDVSQILQDLGFISQFWTKLSPFDAFSEHKSQDVHSGLNVLVCVDDGQNKQLANRAIMTQNIASLTKRRAVMIIEEDKENSLAQTIPTFTVDELQQMKRAFELVKKWVKKYSDLK
ncbi:MAG: helix-turn-helix domain-containing protein [Candidatus Heimdallarchaeota archaeon]|nr:helix-turn-helix domain-containing protein [Candidatus Heimdallarchaeota archaeon]